MAKKLAALVDVSTGGSETSRAASAQRSLLGRTIYLLAESVRVMGILLQPFMPGKAAEMLDVLGVSPDRRTFAQAALGKDFSYGKPLRSSSREEYGGLFPQLEVEG